MTRKCVHCHCKEGSLKGAQPRRAEASASEGAGLPRAAQTNPPHFLPIFSSDIKTTKNKQTNKNLTASGISELEMLAHLALNEIWVLTARH